MLRLRLTPHRQTVRIVALGQLLVRHVLPRLGSLHDVGDLVVGIKATPGSHEGHNYFSGPSATAHASKRVRNSFTE